MRLVKRFVLAWLVLAVSSVLAGFAVRKRVPAFGDESDPQFSVVAVMDGATFESRTQEFVEARATAFMGGIELDLSRAGLAPGAYLTLRAVMGGIDVVVPPNWRVEVMARSMMGGIENLTNPDVLDEDAPVLVIDALAAMGGIEIHAEVGP